MTAVLPHVAFLGTTGESPGIHVYRADGQRWILQQAIATKAPVSLALHPDGRMLYVLQELSEWEGLPRGAVETFQVETSTGKLRSLGCQGLSLSAIMPRHLAVSPDGTALVVAVQGGGAYNLLPIGVDGQLGTVRSIVKETGCGPDAQHQGSARPQTVLFDRNGHVITADMGSDRLTVFGYDAGLRTLSRHLLPAGSGPRHLALHPSSRRLYVANVLSSSIIGLHYDAHAGVIRDQFVQSCEGYGETLAIHPSSDTLYSSRGDEIAAWRIAPATGMLSVKQRTRMAATVVHELIASAEGQALIAVTSCGVARIRVDSTTGALGNLVSITPMAATRCFTMKPLDTIGAPQLPSMQHR
ncbi:lactonase family protein [Bryocella elongata]|nr:beta-propeller fold lactonase family protein [Bryocella elongata]